MIYRNCDCTFKYFSQISRKKNIYKEDQDSIIIQSSEVKVNKRSICETNFYFHFQTMKMPQSHTRSKENAKYLFSHVEGAARIIIPSLKNLA